MFSSMCLHDAEQQMTFYFGFTNVELLFSGLVINSVGGEGHKDQHFIPQWGGRDPTVT